MEINTEGLEDRLEREDQEELEEIIRGWNENSQTDKAEENRMEEEFESPPLDSFIQAEGGSFENSH